MAILEYQDKKDRNPKKDNNEPETPHKTFADKCLQAMLVGGGVTAIGYVVDITPEPGLLFKAIGICVSFLGFGLLVASSIWWLIKKVMDEFF